MATYTIDCTALVAKKFLNVGVKRKEKVKVKQSLYRS